MEIVKKNAKDLDFFDKSKFSVADYRNYIRKASGRDKFDLVFIDPPYAMECCVDAVERLEAKIFKHDLLENKVLFVRLEDTERFPSELNGLIAMQLAAKYKKPTIVARLNEQGFDRGSARGMNQSELRDFREFLLGSGMFEYAQLLLDLVLLIPMDEYTYCNQTSYVKLLFCKSEIHQV